MNFDFSDEQNALREAVRKFLSKESPLALARVLMEQQGTHASDVWQGLVEIGATTAMLPEACGGVGLGALELCVLAEEVGRQLSPVPLCSTLYLASQAMLLGASGAQQQIWLSRVAAGQIAALAAPLDGEFDVSALPRFDGQTLTGTVPLVADGMVAQWAVLLAQDAEQKPVWVVSALEAGMSRQALATLDAAKPYARWELVATPAQALDAGADALALLTRVRDRAAVLLAFEQVGAADAALEMAAAYARERKAFGRTIGSYQGIKHKLADRFTANQMARAHCYYGAWALAADAALPGGAPELAAAAAAARISASQALTLMAQENLHTHGGMGYTWELDCHLFYRRARQQAVQLGNEHVWRERLTGDLEARLDAPEQTAGLASTGAGDGSMDFGDTRDEAAFRAE